MFTTQVPQSLRSSLELNRSKNKQQNASMQKNSSFRSRQIKSKIKNINVQLNQTMKHFIKSKNQLQKTNRQTSFYRTKFLKLYGIKKLKQHEKSLKKQKKFQEHELNENKKNKVKQMKLQNELGLMYTRNQSQLAQRTLRRNNKLEYQNLKQEVRIKKDEEERQAKLRYLEVKQSQNNFILRKKNQSVIDDKRSKYNYFRKVNAEVELLQNYSNIFEAVDRMGLYPSQQFTRSSKDQFSKTFFQETKNTFKD